MSGGDMDHSNDEKQSSLTLEQPKLDTNNQRTQAHTPRHSARRVGYAMSQAPRHRRTSGNADFSSSYQQQIAAAAMAAAATQQCYPIPFFIQQNGPAANGFDTQFVTYPTAGHIEAPFLFYDGKGYSIIPASMIPSTSSFNHLGYFLTPANPAASYAQRPFLHDVAIEHPCLETSDKAVQVNINTPDTMVDDLPVAEEEDYWSVESHTEDLCKQVEICSLIENSNYRMKEKEEEADKCSESGDERKADMVWSMDTSTTYSVTSDPVPNYQEEDFKEETESIIIQRPEETLQCADTARNHRKSWASLFKPGGQPVASNGTSSLPVQPTSNINATGNGIMQWCLPKLTVPSGRYTPRYKIVPDDFAQIGSLFRNFECRQSAPALTPRGFYNSGNYCYVNSVLQALLACPMFFNFVGSLPNLRDAGKLSSTSDKEANPEESGKVENPKFLYAPTFISQVKQIFNSFPPMQRTNLPTRGTPLYRRNQPDLKVGEALHIEDFHHLTESLWSNKALGQQEDAHEFLCHILQEIHNECLLCMKLASNNSPKENKDTAEINGENEEDDDDDSEWQEYYGKRVHIHREIPLDSTPISEIFAGCFRTSLERGGSTTSSNMEPFHSLSLDGDSPTIIHALKTLNSRVPVAGLANPITKKPTKAYQSMMIEKLPPCLILHLKCFVWSKPNGVKKLFPKITIPVDLTIPQEIMSRTSTSSRYYKLFAVIHHRGKTVNNGHYICDVFHPGLPGWIRCDDQRVTVVHSREVLSSTAAGNGEDRSADLSPFILLYRQQ